MGIGETKTISTTVTRLQDIECIAIHSTFTNDDEDKSRQVSVWQGFHAS